MEDSTHQARTDFLQSAKGRKRKKMEGKGKRNKSSHLN